MPAPADLPHLLTAIFLLREDIPQNTLASVMVKEEELG